MHVVSVRLHYFLVSPNIIWLPWQRPLTNRKIRYRSIIWIQSAFIWWKDCENRSSIAGDIWLNTPVFWPWRTRCSQMSSVNEHIEIAISYSILECQCDEWNLQFFLQNWLPWQCPLRYRKKRSRLNICTQNAFIRWKDCENRFSRTWHNGSLSDH